MIVTVGEGLARYKSQVRLYWRWYNSFKDRSGFKPGFSVSPKAFMTNDELQRLVQCWIELAAMVRVLGLSSEAVNIIDNELISTP